MQKNVRGLDENGEEFEMDYEEYEAMQEEIIEEENTSSPDSIE